MKPSTLILCEYLPVIAIASLLPDEAYQVLWSEPKYFSLETTLIHLSVCLAFLTGYFAPLLVERRRSTGSSVRVLTVSDTRLLYRCFWITSFLAVVGYSLFYITAIARGFSPALIAAVLAGDKNLIYQIKFYYFATVPGVTTCTQFGVAATLLGTLLGYLEGWRSVRWPLITILLLTTVRAFVLSERLALIEVLVPSGLLAAYIQLPRLRSSFFKRLLTTGPAFAPFVLYLFFTVAEYFRSWNSYYSTKASSVWLFSFGRLVGYYATALNNSALLFYSSETVSIPYHTLGWLWHFPVIGELSGLREQAIEMDEVWAARLRSNSNVEFNNDGGMYPPLADFGIAGGLIWWFLVGFCGYLLYKRFRDGRLSGLLLFPIFYIGLLEGPRVLYWTNGRAFPQIFALVIVSLLMRSRYVVSRRSTG